MPNMHHSEEELEFQDWKENVKADIQQDINSELGGALAPSPSGDCLFFYPYLSVFLSVGGG